MSSHYAIGRRHEENLVNLLRARGLSVERIPLSGRYHKAKADLLLMHNGEAIYISVKYGTQVPKVLYKADMVKFPGVECFSYPVSGDTQFEAKKLPKFLRKELEHCPVFFGKRARQPWKVAFSSGLGFASLLLAS